MERTTKQAPPIQNARKDRTSIEFAVRNTTWFASSDGIAVVNISTSHVALFAKFPTEAFGFSSIATNVDS